MGIYLVDYENVHNDGVTDIKNSLHLTVLSFLRRQHQVHPF